MELWWDWISRKFGVKSLLHSNGCVCVCVQKNENGRVGGERRSKSSLVMKLSYLFKNKKKFLK